MGLFQDFFNQLFRPAYYDKQKALDLLNAQNAAMLQSKYNPNYEDYEVVGMKDSRFMWLTDSGVDNSVDDDGNSGLDLDTFDTTTRPDSANILVDNASGSSKTVRGASIRGKPVVRLSGENGYLHEDFIDYEDIYRNGENKFELGNNYICTKMQTEALADFHWKNFREKRHVYTVSMVGTRYWFSPGEWYTLQIGGAGEQEYVDSVVECYSVQVERGVGELGTTVVTFREVYEHWVKDSSAIARYIAGGNPANFPDYARVVVASSTHMGQADYYCDGTSDEDEINAAISELAGDGGGCVELTEGTYYTDGAIAPADNIMLVGKGWKTIIEKNGNYDGFYLLGSEGNEYSNICLKDFKLTRNANDTNTEDLAYFNHTDNITIDNIYCTDGDDDGLVFDNCENITIINCLVDDFDGCGIYITGGDGGHRIIGNYCSNCTGTVETGIMITSGENTIISNNTCVSNDIGIDVVGSDLCTINSNLCKSNDIGIRVTSNADNNVITGNIAENNTTYGIRIHDNTCDRNVVTGNRATNNGTNFSDAGTNTFYQTATDGDPLNDFN